MKYKCKKLAKLKKQEKDHFESIISKGIMTNKEFWEKEKPALSAHNPTSNTNITLQEDNDLIYNDNKISEILNNQYINIVEISTGSAPKNPRGG